MRRHTVTVLVPAMAVIVAALVATLATPETASATTVPRATTRLFAAPSTMERVLYSPTGSAGPNSAMNAPNTSPTYSGNWAGYVVSGSNGEYTSAQATFVVPTVTCDPAEDSNSSDWAGLDGYSSSDDTVEQEGVNVGCTNDVPFYYAWYEMYPAGWVVFPTMTVSPGDTIIATTTYANGTYDLNVHDATTGVSVDEQVSGALDNSSAECITEDNNSGNMYGVYANYGHVDYSECEANGEAIGLQDPIAIDTTIGYDGQPVVGAQTDTLINNTAFAVEQVTPYPTTTTLAVSPTPIRVGATTSLSGAVSDLGVEPWGLPPSGTFSYEENGNPVTYDVNGDPNGVCSYLYMNFSCTTVFSTPGLVTLTISYSGDGEFIQSSDTQSYMVYAGPLGSSVTLTASATPTTIGTPTTLTATVTGSGATPTGTVTFENGGTTISGCGSETVDGSGVATCTTTFGASGIQALSAVYSGDGTYSTATGTESEAVSPRSSAVTLSVNPPSITAGTTTVLTATVTGSGAAPTGTVAFESGGQAVGGCGSQDVNGAGVATCVAAFPSAGTESLTATYSGDGNYFGSTSASASLTVSAAPVPAPPVDNGGLNASVTGMAAMPDGLGYWVVAANGAVTAHGDAVNYGGMAGAHLNAPISHIVSTSDGKGYWLVASDGGTFTFGDAGFYGSTGNMHLNAPVVDIAPTLDDRGYWLVASDGGIFSFGNAHFYGSMGGTHLNQPVVGITVDPATGGYWLVAKDGGIFSFNAPFLGSTGDIHLNKPILSLAATSDGQGYWFVASDGGIFAYGDAGFHGSLGATPLSAPVVAMAADSASGGYWIGTADGTVYAEGAPSYGSH